MYDLIRHRDWFNEFYAIEDAADRDSAELKKLIEKIEIQEKENQNK